MRVVDKPPKSRQSRGLTAGYQQYLTQKHPGPIVFVGAGCTEVCGTGKPPRFCLFRDKLGGFTNAVFTYTERAASMSASSATVTKALASGVRAS